MIKLIPVIAMIGWALLSSPGHATPVQGLELEEVIDLPCSDRPQYVCEAEKAAVTCYFDTVDDFDDGRTDVNVIADVIFRTCLRDTKAAWAARWAWFKGINPSAPNLLQIWEKVPLHSPGFAKVWDDEFRLYVMQNILIYRRR